MYCQVRRECQLFPWRAACPRALRRLSFSVSNVDRSIGRCGKVDAAAPARFIDRRLGSFLLVAIRSVCSARCQASQSVARATTASATDAHRASFPPGFKTPPFRCRGVVVSSASLPSVNARSCCVYDLFGCYFEERAAV